MAKKNDFLSDELEEQFSSRQQGYTECSDCDPVKPTLFKTGRFPLKREFLCHFNIDLGNHEQTFDFYIVRPTPRKRWWVLWVKMRFNFGYQSHTYPASPVAYLKSEEDDNIENVGMYLLTQFINEACCGPSFIRAGLLSKNQLLGAVLLSKYWSGLRAFYLAEALKIKNTRKNYSLKQLRALYLEKIGHTK